MVAWMRNVAEFRKSSFDLAVSRFSNPPRIEDLDTLTLDEGDLKDILVMAPVTALLLIVSVLGLPVGIAILIGLLTTAFCVGEFEDGLLKRAPAATRSRRLLLLVSGVATLAILRAVPFIGPWIVFVSVLFGLGALGIWLYRSYAPAAAAV